MFWYNCDCLQDVECIQPIVGVCYKFWPTIGVDAALQNAFMKMLVIISNDSLPGKNLSKNVTVNNFLN